MSTYHDLLKEYRKDFEEAGYSRETLKLFLFELCNEKDVDLYVEMENEALPSIEEKYRNGVKRLMKDEPLNYVLGYSWFFGYKMIVNRDVLIPRFETEELVGFILGEIDLYKPEGEIILADVGTGSGAIAIALEREEARLKVFASDISKEALEVAKMNAEANEAEIAFLQGSMLSPFIEQGIILDILVSNPPYIPREETIETSVYDYEPHVALFGGEDGLRFYREVFENAEKILKKDGMMFFEIGYDQAERLTALAREHFPEAHIEIRKDINRKDRMLEIRL